MSVGVVEFPCPKCSQRAPVDVVAADAATLFACRNAKCGYKKALGARLPSMSALLAEHGHLEPDAARAKIVDALTAWYLDWTVRS